jgi:hypothetical protein
VLATSQGYKPGEKVVVSLYPQPVKLAISTVRTNGEVYANFTIPKRTSPGTHLIQVTGYQDCRVTAATVEIVSPSGAGSSIFPWIVWLTVGGAVILALLCLLFARILGWLPSGLGVGTATGAAS